MDRMLDADFLIAQWRTAEVWLYDEVLTVESLVQLLVVIAALALAAWLGPRLGRAIVGLSGRRGGDQWYARFAALVSHLAFAAVWLVLLWAAGLVLSAVEWPLHILRIVVSLLAAWVVIGLVSTLFRERMLSRTVAVVAWSVAALNIVGILDETIVVLDSVAFSFGDVRISALTMIKGVLALTVLLWAATLFANLLDRRIQRVQGLTPSVQVLFTKLAKVLLVALAVVIAIQSVGVDLSAFTVFTGALGVGIGFGLQKLVSNLLSGVMILMDRSIKPGDVIEVGETYGWVNSLGSRYVSVTTRDGIEHLIPNEDLITQRVSNWSHSNNELRLRLGIGISYRSDVRQAMALILEAAGEVDRVLDSPRAVCLLKGFGDSSVDLELRFWINDPRNGLSNVRSDILLRVWDKFHAHGIEIPFPQRDLHLRSAEPLRVSLDEGLTS